MKNHLRALSGFVMLAVVPLVAADPAYVGTWKLNAARSQLTGDTVTIANAPDGTMTFDGQGFTYTFKVDGKKYPTPDGASASWTQAGPDTWDVAITGGDKPIASYRAVVNGDTMRLVGKLTKPDGTTNDFKVSYKRSSGGPGLAGKWTSTEVTAPVSRLDVAATPPDGVTITDDSGAVFSGQFDGKVTPALGRLKGSKLTTVFKKTGPNGFEITTNIDGKAMYAEVYSVSADGKTLTLNGTPTNAPTETYKVVFDRQ